MLKQGLSLIQTQKLSPLQIQFIKLLQIPTAELDDRIKEELEINPALEEGPSENSESTSENEQTEEIETENDLDIKDYLHNDEYGGYKMQGDGPNIDDDDYESPLSSESSLMDQLISQLGFLKLNDQEHAIGLQLIGSIESDGYIRRDISAIVNDLAFTRGIDTDADEVESVLMKLQNFDPPGIGARNLQECLLLQLERKDDHPEVCTLAEDIIKNFFDEFTRKHYDKIQKRICPDQDELFKDAINLIKKLNPKPGGSEENIRTQFVIPDFILIREGNKLELSLNSKNAPELKVSREYAEMLHTYDKSNKTDKKLKETVSFVKQKLDGAKWFIDAIKQRQNTLLQTMNTIVKFQYEFFISGDENNLKPMILKDIADIIEMDISTISRVANSKTVQTEFGIYPLKYFFSEGISTDTGEDVSSREVKNKLKEIIDNEDKNHPISDEKIEKILNDQGYNIARRTVAKYREQLNIPVARPRKEIQ